MTNVVEQAKHVHRTNRACSPNKLGMFAGQAGLVRMHEAMQTYAQAYACVCIASCVRTCKPDLHLNSYYRAGYMLLSCEAGRYYCVGGYVTIV